MEVAAAEVEVQDTDDWTRGFGGALVQFEGGAAIAKVSLPSDFSSVRFNKLPRDTSVESVEAMLVDLGVTLRPEDVRILPSAAEDPTNCSVIIKVEDPLFAKNLCSKTALLASRNIEAVLIPAPSDRTSNRGRIDCRKVNCSWHRPVKLVWMNFGNRDIASKVQRRFASGVSKVLNQKVEANSPTGSNKGYNPLGWTVVLSSVPAAATEADILATIPSFQQPRNVNIGKPSYGVDGATARATVKSMIWQIGPLEWWKDSLESNAKRAKAQARFLDDANAREAVRVLNDAPLSFSDKARLTVQLITTAKFRISNRLYDAVGPRIEAQKQTWDGKHLRFTPYDPTKGFRVLKIEGEQMDDVTDAAATLEKILAGEKVMRDGEPLWSPSLPFNGETYQRLRKLEQENGFVLVRNKRKSHLRLFGSEEKCRRAEELIAAIVQEGESPVFTIKLTSTQLQWARRGGFKALSASLGDSTVALDNVFNPKCIFIMGSEEHYRRAMEFIESQDSGSSLAPGTESDCCVCWTPAEEPVHTNCGHVYCGECFDNLCQSYSSVSASAFRISCKGDGDRCKTVFSLNELEDNLPTDTLEELLEASFKSYIAKNPLRFRYCPTPDCEYVYRVGTGGTHACSKCQAVICTSCHNSHGGMTCSEYSDLTSGRTEANRKLMQELNIKECPKCKTAIEKTEGCNHMECGGCNIHICWKCLATFTSGTLCYDHLSKMHGGAFDVDDPVDW